MMNTIKMELDGGNYVEIRDVAGGISCMDCEKWFKNHTQLKSHMWRHTGEKPFGCMVCNRRFTQQGNLKAHMRIHTGEKPYPCIEPGCDAKFTQRSNLKAHMKIHTGEKPFKCGYCTSAFRQATNLRTHRAIHTGERPHKCDICCKGFTQKSNLKAHKDRVHRSFKKEIDDTVTLNLGQDDSLYNNLNILYAKDGSDSYAMPNQSEIIVETDHSADYCIAPTVEILIPESIMTKDEPFEFPTEKSESFEFPAVKTEYGHMEIDIPYIKDEPSLDMGIIKNNIGNRYSCQICNYSYLSARDLKIHRCIRGLRYFECDLCKDSLQSLADLKNHQASHLESKKYSCSLCGLLFINRSKLKSHHKLHATMCKAHLKDNIQRITDRHNIKKFWWQRYHAVKRQKIDKTNSTINTVVSDKVIILKDKSNNNVIQHTVNGRHVKDQMEQSYRKAAIKLKMSEKRIAMFARKQSLCQQYAVSYKHFRILQRKFIRTQNMKHLSNRKKKFVYKNNSKQISHAEDNLPLVSISRKKDISPLFMCFECKSYFTSLDNIKSHMEIHRTKNTVKMEYLNTNFNSQNVFVISDCLKYDEPMVQMSRT